MSKRTGGCAFPNDGMWANGHPEGGMTLRDYFATHAMMGMQASPALLEVVTAGDIKDGSYAAKMARTAYSLADAMLAERDKAGAE